MEEIGVHGEILLKVALKHNILFHHFKAIYHFPKHIILLVKIVANTSLTLRAS
jgi:hypothetical protein